MLVYRRVAGLRERHREQFDLQGFTGGYVCGAQKLFEAPALPPQDKPAPLQRPASETCGIVTNCFVFSSRGFVDGTNGEPVHDVAAKIIDSAVYRRRFSAGDGR